MLMTIDWPRMEQASVNTIKNFIDENWRNIRWDDLDNLTSILKRKQKENDRLADKIAKSPVVKSAFVMTDKQCGSMEEAKDYWDNFWSNVREIINYCARSRAQRNKHRRTV